MRHARNVVLWGAAVFVVGSCLAIWLAAELPVLAAPPLSLEGYLDEKLPEAPKQEQSHSAINNACFVCHGNYREEELATTHAKNKVGCMECHGESLDHRNDENNTTPPDVMYPWEEINNYCRKCHKQHDAPAREVVARWKQRCPQKTDPEKIVCTDCHGDHRLKRRSVQWNKKTGELLPGTQEPAGSAQ